MIRQTLTSKRDKNPVKEARNTPGRFSEEKSIMLPSETNCSSHHRKGHAITPTTVNEESNTNSMKCNCHDSVDTKPSRRISNPVNGNVGSPLAKVGMFIAKKLFSLVFPSVGKSGSDAVEASACHETSGVILDDD